jgi:hypothetical protein
VTNDLLMLLRQREHRDDIPKAERKFECVGAALDEMPNCSVSEPIMGYGMCRLDPPGHCNWFVAPSSGFAQICAHCGHNIEVHN